MTITPDIASEEQIRREKEKARQLRKTQWWRNRIHEGVCHYCRSEVGRDQLTMDHVVPLSRGGKSRKGNVVACCKACNARHATIGKNRCCRLNGRNTFCRSLIWRAVNKAPDRSDKTSNTECRILNVEY
jgi:hypothetical protein